jgi:hypothetical protein
MHPLQIWLPTFHAALSSAEEQRDKRRAWDAWRGEHVVWLLPGLTKPQRWIAIPAEPGMPDNMVQVVLAVPGEHLECMRVYHVTDTGVVWGPGAMDCFPALTIGGLLNAWVNQQIWDVVWLPPTTVVKIPTIREHENGIKVTYVEECIHPSILASGRHAPASCSRSRKYRVLRSIPAPSGRSSTDHDVSGAIRA